MATIRITTCLISCSLVTLLLYTRPAMAQNSVLAPADSARIALAPNSTSEGAVTAVESATAEPSSIPATAAAPDTVTTGELRRLDAQWANATLRNDAQTLSQLMTSDYVSIGSNGQVLTRIDILQAIANDRVKIAVNKGFNYNIKVYGEVGIVLHNTSFVGSSYGKDTSGTYCSTSIFVRRAGRWQLASSQTTAIAQPESRTALRSYR